MPEQQSLFDDQSQELHPGEEQDLPVKRKLQVSNGYLLEFEQISRILSAAYERMSSPKITRAAIVEATGLPNRGVEAYVSMAAAMGLLRQQVQVPTAFGTLVAAQDIFFERQGTLEWCHYRGSGSVRNLVWFDVFNRLLLEEDAMTHLQWNGWFRRDLAGRYSERTLRKVVQEEVHFVIDGYLNRKLKVLELLEVADGEVLVPRRHRDIEHLIFAAMLYDCVGSLGGRTMEITELSTLPGGPAVVFGLKADSVRTLVEALHNKGWIRYETTHNLDQLRLIPGYDCREFLRAYYEGREPVKDSHLGGTNG